MTRARNTSRSTAKNYESTADTRQYFHAVAQARYVIRRVMRIVDEQAKKESLEPLEHQALIQVCGAADGSIQVNQLAERLDIVAAFASRLARSLETKGLLTRQGSQHDRRITLLQVTPQGLDVLSRINDRVHRHVGVFKEELSDLERAAAFEIFSFYVGIPTENGNASKGII
jgi:DNA-binding MarR family transcriptional regulator